MRDIETEGASRPRRANGEVAAVDASVGKLRRSLRELGIAENTLLWFHSDNGPSIGDPGSTGGLRGADNGCRRELVCAGHCAVMTLDGDAPFVD